MPVNCWRTCYLAAASQLDVVICGRKATGSYLLRGSNFFFFGLECVKINRTCGCVCNTVLCCAGSAPSKRLMLRKLKRTA